MLISLSLFSIHLSLIYLTKVSTLDFNCQANQLFTQCVFARGVQHLLTDLGSVRDPNSNKQILVNIWKETRGRERRGGEKTATKGMIMTYQE